MLGGTIKLNPVGLLAVGSVAIMIYLLTRWNSSSSQLSSAIAVEGDLASSDDQAPLTMKRLLVEGVLAAERGGMQVTAVHRSAKLNVHNKGKSGGAVEAVTDADFASHRAIKASLESAFKGHGIRLVSEERVEDGEKYGNIALTPIVSDALLSTSLLPDGPPVDATDVTVWIDPLDATQEFTEDLLDYVTVLVCVAIKSRPIIGIVHRPFQSETFWAWVGQGSSPNLRPLQKDNQVEIQNSTRKIIVSRSHAGRVADMAKKAFGDNVQVTSAGGAGYKVLQVIQGVADVYLHMTLIKKWDICAGNALLDTVRGRMTTLDGRNIEYSRASHVINEAGLLAAVHSHRKYLDMVRDFRQR